MLELLGFRLGCLRTENVDANERQWNYRHTSTALGALAAAARRRFHFPVTWSSLPIKSRLACGPAGMSYGGGPRWRQQGAVLLLPAEILQVQCTEIRL